MAGVDWNVTDASFFTGTENVTFHVALPQRISGSVGMTSQEVTSERRLQISERALIDGAEVEDFGRKARIFTAEVIFFGTDYLPQVSAFEKALNSGKSGTLILPDLEEAVFAKYQKHSRKSTTQDGGSTILSVTWIEDNSTQKLFNFERSQAQASASLQSGNVLDALPTVNQSSGGVLSKISSARSALNANDYLNKLSAAEGAVVSATQAINTALNAPKALRTEILSVVQRARLELSSLESAVKGIQNLSDLLNLGLSQLSPTRFNTGSSAIDFVAVDDPVTAVVAGNQAVVVTPTVAPKTISSFPDATVSLTQSVAAISKSKADLESKTSGKTSDFSAAAVQLVNSVKDLSLIIATGSTKAILTTSQSSLLEICFRNGLTVTDIDRIYRLNTQLTDILNIPAFTVVNL